MKKQFMLAKQGLAFKLISIVLQLIVSVPLFLLLSFFVSAVIIEITASENTVLIYKIIFVLFNILWFIRNSIITVYNDKIIIRDWIGAKQIIDTVNITSLKMIDYKELRRMIFESSGTNPLITNAFAFIIPMGKFITFKNQFGRVVVIGIWNCNRLYKILQDNVSEVESAQKKNCNISNLHSTFDAEKRFICFVKMPFKYHLLTYLKLFPETIIIPLFFAGYLGWMLHISDVGVLILLPIAFALSLFIYYRKIRIVVDAKSTTIRIKLFYNRNKSVIKYENIKNLHFINSKNDIAELKEKSVFFINTPYSVKNVKELIAFELPNNISVLLSVNKPYELYDLINNQACVQTEIK